MVGVKKRLPPGEYRSYFPMPSVVRKPSTLAGRKSNSCKTTSQASSASLRTTMLRELKGRRFFTMTLGKVLCWTILDAGNDNQLKMETLLLYIDHAVVVKKASVGKIVQNT